MRGSGARLEHHPRQIADRMPQVSRPAV